jgi:hypothetical protein
MPNQPFRWIVVGAGLMLASYLLFCHGCHGDGDDELVALTFGYPSLRAVRGAFADSSKCRAPNSEEL